jgi:hypothetical protein
MKKIIGVAAVAIMLSSCTVFHSITVTNNDVGTKTGVAKGKSFQADNDVTAEKACKNGGIKKIGTMEIKMKYFLFFTSTTTTITGE